MIYLASLPTLILLAPYVLSAQAGAVAPEGTEPRQVDITGAMAEPLLYTPPTAADRWNYLYSGALSPAALGCHAASAGYSQLVNSIPDWGYGAEGYGHRLGWVVLNNVAQLAIESGIAAAIHEDTGYYRCACSGFFRRSAHALLSQLTTRRPDGRRSLSLARPIGAYGGAIVATSVLPGRFTVGGDGVREGTWNYAIGFSVNLLREFWPEIRYGVFRKR